MRKYDLVHWGQGLEFQKIQAIPSQRSASYFWIQMGPLSYCLSGLLPWLCSLILNSNPLEPLGSDKPFYCLGRDVLSQQEKTKAPCL